MKAEVLTPMVNVGTGIDMWYPQIKLDHPSLAPCRDVTAQDGANIPTAPNMQTRYIECDEATLNQIIADPKYPVIWCE